MNKLLSKLKKLNISIDLINDKLDVVAPKDIMTEELLNEIKEHKEDLIKFISAQKNSVRVEYTPINLLGTKEDYVLSSAQRRLWLLSQINESNTAYNMSSTFRITGELDIESLEKAFETLIERHEILRTNFGLDVEGNAKQTVLSAPESKFVLEFEDVSRRKKKDEIIKKNINKETTYSFDITSDSLLRAKLIKISKDNYVFNLVMHHIISDGWSLQVLSKEIFTLYDAYTKGNKNPLMPLSIHYKDYAAWQQEQLEKGELDDHKQYWLEQFSGGLPILNLPGSSIKPKTEANEGRVIRKSYDTKLIEAFKRLCKEEDTTLFMGLMSIVKLLLCRYTNQNDIIVGTPVSGREHPDLLEQLGFYINLLGLRTNIDDQESYTELLLKLKKNTLNAYNHQNYPFDKLVEDLPLAGNTLFDIILTLENKDREKEQKIGGLSIEEYNLIEATTSKFGLEFVFKETDNGLDLFLTYDTSIYEYKFVQQITTHLETLFDQVINNPNAPVRNICLLSKEEREKVLLEFNDTKTVYPKDKTFLELFKNQVQKTPDKVVIVDDNQSLTYKELDSISDSFAHYLLKEHTIKNEDLVGVKLGRSKWLIISMLGILKSGGVYLPIDPNYPKDRIAYIEKDSGCQITIDKQFIEVFEAQKPISDTIEIKGSASDLAYVIYTSGSTGKPKGVAIEHKSLVNLCYWHIRHYEANESSRATVFSGTAFDASIWEICPYLISGGTLYPISDNDTRIDTRKLSVFFKDNNITHCYVPTQICQSLVEDEFYKDDLTIVTGGDVLKLGKETDLTIYNNYGPTENTVVTTSFQVQKSNTTNIPIGKPISNTQVYILNDSLNLLPIGFVGRLFVSGDSVARGYLNRPELTKERFVNNPFAEGKKIYDTGDLAYWLPDGNIAFAGRKDEQVKIRGFRIELGEIEQLLIQQKNIKQALVSVKEIQGQKQLIAYVLPEGKIDKQKLKLSLQKELPVYMVPACFIEIDSIPLTANGKINKDVLPIPTESDFTNTNEFIKPETKLEKELVKIWSEVLGIKSMGIESVLFDLGGSSISIAKIINKVRLETGYTITFKDVFENPTIRGIIPFLKESAQDIELPIIPGQESYPLTSAQLRFWLLCQMPEVNKAYNIPFTIKLKGNLNIELLNEAFKLLIQRHETLRTSFIQNSDGEIQQQVQSIDAFDFNLDLITLDPQDVLSDTISEFNRQSFDLTQAPLIKGCLIKTNDNCFYLSIIVHHIVFDGQSLQILMKDVSTLYNGLLSSSKIDLPELKVQFKDYTSWANNLMSDNRVKQHQFWINELSGELPILNIPTYQNRPKIQTYNGNSLSYQLNDRLLKKLEKFSKRQKTTDFTVLLAALKGLLFRYTSQTDIIIGTPVLGREHTDLENQIGLYINTIPIRTRFNKSDDFNQLVSNQKNTLVKAYANSGYSFGDILNGLSLHRDTSRSPVFDILVIYQKQTDNSTNFTTLFDEASCESYEDSKSFVSKYDITFSFLEFDGHLSISAEYNIDLYEQSFIENMIVNFENFLEGCIKDPTQEIQEISYVGKTQADKLLNEFNDTQKNIDFQKTVVDLFVDRAKLSSKKTAIICENKKITYKELDQKSNQLAIYLKEKGVKPNSTVGVFLGRSIEVVVAILGILKSGASYLPLDPFYPIHRTDYILKNSETNFVVTNNETKDVLPNDLITINLNDQVIWEKNCDAQFTSPEPLSMAYVIYTSGSTGKPKGVKVSHKNLSNFIAGMNHKFDSKSESDVWLAMTSMSFDISILELLWTLTEGNKIVMHLERPIPVESKPKMDFSLFYFPTYNNTTKQQNKYELLLEGAKFADQNQFEAIWVPERHFHNFGDQFPNPSVAAAAVSSITKNIKLRSGSVVLPLHDPIRVAEEWSMVDNLSEGRVELSIASGWHPNDFVLAPNSYENRHQVMREGITTLKNVWKGKSVTRKNGVGKDYEFYVHPKPIQKELPLWITAAGSIETFKYAGSIGANILTHLLGQSIDDLEEKIKVYRQTLIDNGYNPEKYKVALMLHTFVSDDLDFVKQTVERPFKNYLKNSINLLKPIAEELDLDLDNDLEPLLDIGYQRFYNTSSLFGTPESCHNMVNRVYEIGIDEVACLIDFGVDQELVIDNLKYLFDLKDSIKRGRAQHDFLVKTIDKLTESESTAQLINNHKVTHMQSTPSLYEELLLNDKGREALKNIKTLMVGGEALKKSLAQKLIHQVGSSIHNMYGPTETTIWSSVKTITQDENITIGKPIINTKIYILDANNQLCPERVSGELCIGGDGVTLGYLNKETLTNERFIDNPFVENEKIYRTGDLACWLPDGELRYQGRLDSQVKIKGYRIELKEIENVILDHKSIIQSAVSAIDENNQTFLVAYIKTADTLDDDVLKEYLRLRLPHYMIPQHIIMLEEFPQTPNGKIDFKALPRPNDTVKQAKKYIAPRNETEEQLSILWGDFLKAEQLSIDDNFFEIGGNSMKAFQLLSLINTSLNTDIKILSFFQYPTIRTLAEHLDNAETAQKVQIEENEMEDVEDLIDFMSDI